MQCGVISDMNNRLFIFAIQPSINPNQNSVYAIHVCRIYYANFVCITGTQKAIK